MWNPFRQRTDKSPKSRADNPNSMANLRQGPAPAPTERLTEAKTMDIFTKTTESMTNAITAMDNFSKAMAARSAPAMPDDGYDDGMDWLGLLETLAPHFAPYIGPYIGSILEKAGIQPTPNPAAAGGAPNPPAPAGIDIAKLIPLAASAPEGAIKLFLPQLREGLAKQGIDEQQFKAACLKIGKVL